MEKIPTAEEFFSKDNGLYTVYSVKDKDGNFQSVCSYEKAVEFAKLHVEAALKAAHKNAKVTSTGYPQYNAVVTRYSIINAYPLENIK